MNIKLFKKKLKSYFDSRSSKSWKDTANFITNVYDEANKSLAFTMFGQKFSEGDVDTMRDYLEKGFGMIQVSKDLGVDTKNGWIYIARGFIWYWNNSKFEDNPPVPGLNSTKNAVKVLPPTTWADREKLAEKIKLCFSEGTSELNLKSLSNVLTQDLHDNIKGIYTGITPNGVITPVPWVGVLGEKPEIKEKEHKIELLSKSTWIPISKPQGYSIRFIDGPFGKYAARFDSRGNKIVPSTNETNLRKANQINGRLSWDVLVDVKGEPGLLERNAGNAYLKMKEDAGLQGVDIKFNSVISGYRPLGKRGDLELRRKGSLKHKTQWAAREDYDECMFDNGGGETAKENCKKRFAMPTFDGYGTSNHGWGRSLDMGWINENTKGQQWIRENGWKYGWYWGEQMDEEWHFTWVLDGYIPENAGVGTYYIRDEKGKLHPSNEQ
jgi:LAS superfamily LD-carboxypeptidase LdcB